MSGSGAKTSFEHVLREHNELREMLDELREFLGRPRPETEDEESHGWAVALSGRLVGLHDKLSSHFRHEEQVGVLDELTRRKPRASKRIEALKGEHREILDGVRGLVADTLSYSEGTAPEDPRLRQRLTTLLDSLTDHERVETELIQRLEYRDLGAGD